MEVLHSAVNRKLPEYLHRPPIKSSCYKGECDVKVIIITIILLSCAYIHSPVITKLFSPFLVSLSQANPLLTYIQSVSSILNSLVNIRPTHSPCTLAPGKMSSSNYSFQLRFCLLGSLVNIILHLIIRNYALA